MISLNCQRKHLKNDSQYVLSFSLDLTLNFNVKLQLRNFEAGHSHLTQIRVAYKVFLESLEDLGSMDGIVLTCTMFFFPRREIWSCRHLTLEVYKHFTVFST